MLKTSYFFSISQKINTRFLSFFRTNCKLNGALFRVTHIYKKYEIIGTFRIISYFCING